MQQTAKNRTACFTGHRDIRKSDLFLRHKLKKVLIGLIEEGYRHFGAGGAKGFDMMAAEVVLELRKQYPDINLIFVLPFINQYEHEGTWTSDEILRYHALKQQAQKVVHLQEKYSSGCYYRRNRHLVDFSSVCVCYQYKAEGGTAFTTRYAMQNGLRIINCIE